LPARNPSPRAPRATAWPSCRRPHSSACLPRESARALPPLRRVPPTHHSRRAVVERTSSRAPRSAGKSAKPHAVRPAATH
jgi:hypothetical protein